MNSTTVNEEKTSLVQKEAVAIFTGEQYEGDKRYYIDKNNRRYISVTTLLGLYEDKTTILEWRLRKGEEVADQITADSIVRGKTAHAQLENFFFNSIEPPEDSYSKRAIDHFYSLVSIESMEQQIIYFDELVRLGGKYDAIVNVPENCFIYKDDQATFLPSGKYIVDLKTKTKMPNLSNILCSFKYLLQGSAYTVAAEQMHEDLDISGFILVYVSPRAVRMLVIDREDIRFYWKHVYRLLLDHFDVKTLNATWSQMANSAEATYDPKTGDMISRFPREIKFVNNIKKPKKQKKVKQLDS